MFRFSSTSSVESDDEGDVKSGPYEYSTGFSLINVLSTDLVGFAPKGVL